MRMLVTKVKQAALSVDDQLVSAINTGYVVYLGVSDTDNPSIVKKCAEKLSKLRIFHDEAGKMNLSLDKEKHEILVVSQFTLYGDASNNNRPSFTRAAKPDLANDLYLQFVGLLREMGYAVKTGVFGAHMVIDATYIGPFNLIYELGD